MNKPRNITHSHLDRNDLDQDDGDDTYEPTFGLVKSRQRRTKALDTLSKSARETAPPLVVPNARIVATFGRYWLARMLDSEDVVSCVSRGRAQDVAVGDLAHITRNLNQRNQGVIEHIAPRNNLFFRSDAFKSKRLAANISQLILVGAIDPGMSDEWLARALVAAHDCNVPVHLIVNKMDLTDSQPLRHQAALAQLTTYTPLVESVQYLSIFTQPEAALMLLQPLITGHTTLLIGQSGSGKSSLINLLIPDAHAPTNTISTALHSGKHTTTATRWYDVADLDPSDHPSALIDSPGFLEFGLHHVPLSSIINGFQDFIPYTQYCRFHNCLHLKESGCGVLAALTIGDIDPRRHAAYTRMMQR